MEGEIFYIHDVNSLNISSVTDTTYNYIDFVTLLNYKRFSIGRGTKRIDVENYVLKKKLIIESILIKLKEPQSKKVGIRNE